MPGAARDIGARVLVCVSTCRHRSSMLPRVGPNQAYITRTADGKIMFERPKTTAFLHEVFVVTSVFDTDADRAVVGHPRTAVYYRERATRMLIHAVPHKFVFGRAEELAHLEAALSETAMPAAQRATWTPMVVDGPEELFRRSFASYVPDPAGFLVEVARASNLPAPLAATYLTKVFMLFLAFERLGGPSRSVFLWLDAGLFGELRGGAVPTDCSLAGLHAVISRIVGLLLQHQRTRSVSVLGYGQLSSTHVPGKTRIVPVFPVAAQAGTAADPANTPACSFGCAPDFLMAMLTRPAQWARAWRASSATSTQWSSSCGQAATSPCCSARA